MNVVFAEPFFPASQRQFARALAHAYLRMRHPDHGALHACAS